MNLINMLKSLFLTRIAAPEDTHEEAGPSEKRPRVEFVCGCGYRAKNSSLLKRHELIHMAKFSCECGRMVACSDNKVNLSKF